MFVYSDKIFSEEYPSDTYNLTINVASWLTDLYLYYEPNQNIKPVSSATGAASLIKLIIVLEVIHYQHDHKLKRHQMGAYR